MMKRVVQIGLLVGMGILMVGTASATMLVSSLGNFGDANAVFEQQFTYDPATMGALLIIQTYGYGGSSNAPGGTNSSGTLIASGGFDPMIALYFGTVGGGGARIAGNDDQPDTPTFTPCGPGSGADDPITTFCRDSRLVFNSLAAGTYTVALSVFSNTPPPTENGAYPGTGSFSGRTAAFAIDVTAVPEPVTSMLLGSALLAIGVMVRRKRRG